MGYFIGLDVGTTRTKAGLFTAQGTLLASGACDNQAQRAGHKAELAATAYWDAARDAVKQMLRRSPVPSREIMGLSLSAQGVTFVPVDSRGRALCDAIVAHDERGYEELPAVLDRFNEDEFYLHTGVPHLDRVNDVPKFVWLRKHHPAVWSRLAKLLLVGDYIAYRLTGEHAGEPTSWSSASLYDAIAGDWWQEMLAFLGLSSRQLPTLHEAGSILGEILPDVADDLGLGRGTPVVVGTMDQVAAALAVGSVTEGVVSLSTGTVLAVGATARQSALRDRDRRVFGYPHALRDATFLFSYSPTGGVALDWFCETFFRMGQGGSLSGAELVDIAVQAPLGADGLVMLPHLMGMHSPRFRPEARGAFVGFSLAHGREHFARALLEGIAYMARDHLHVLREVGVNPQTVRAMGGGARSDVWLQMMADVLHIAVEVPACREAAALGAAILAAVGAGYYASIGEAVRAMCRFEGCFEPNPPAVAAYDSHYAAYTALCERIYGG